MTDRFRDPYRQSDHVMGVKKTRYGWASGVVHPRVRRGEPAVELRSVRHFTSLREAAADIARPDRINGHKGVRSSFTGVTGSEDAEVMLGRLLYRPAETLREMWERSGLTQREWARRAKVDVRSVRRIVNEGQEPLTSTLRKLLEALQ